MNYRAAAQGLLVALVVALLVGTGLLDRPRWAAYHGLFDLRGPRPPYPQIVLVTIDDASMEDLGVWPFSRRYYGELLDGLFQAGARVVGLDVVFAQPSTEPGADAAFAAALARHKGQVVLAANRQPPLDTHLQGDQAILPTRELRNQAIVGFVDLPFDADGAIHRLGPNLGLVGDSADRPRIVGFDVAIASRHGIQPNPTWFESADAPWLIDFVGPPGSFPHMSFSAAIDAIRSKDLKRMRFFDGKIVLVGAASLRLQDQYPTPFSATALGGGAAQYMPGVEIHANVLHTMMSAQPPFGRGPIRSIPFPWEAAGLLLLGGAAGLLFARIRPWHGLAALVAAAGLIGIVSVAAFSAWIPVWLDPIAPTTALAGIYAIAVFQHFLQAESMRRFYRRTFEAYVAPEIVEKLLHNPALAPKLGGERREVTVLFSDIRNFTTISEERSPEAVVEVLNEYLTAMADIILAEGGCIDKYIGDAILAVWGNVEPMAPEAAARAGVRTALAMQARLEVLRPIWLARGYPHIAIGVGVNTGDAIVGNIGSPRKLEFGVIGDSINVASRLEGLTKEYGAGVLVSGRTRDLLGDGFACTPLDDVKVKGRAQTVAIHRVDGLAGGTGPGTGRKSP